MLIQVQILQSLLRYNSMFMIFSVKNRRIAQLLLKIIRSEPFGSHGFEFFVANFAGHCYISSSVSISTYLLMCASWTTAPTLFLSLHLTFNSTVLRAIRSQMPNTIYEHDLGILFRRNLLETCIYSFLSDFFSIFFSLFEFRLYTEICGFGAGNGLLVL